MIAALIAGFARLATGATARWLVEPRSERQRVYFANHASHFDFVTIWAALPPPQRAHTRPVAAADYWTAGRIKRYLAARVFRALLIDRSGGDSARRATEQMVGALRDGDSLIIFPEGTRGDGGEIAPFKSGLYHLAMAAPDAELVPVLLENLNRVPAQGRNDPGAGDRARDVRCAARARARARRGARRAARTRPRGGRRPARGRLAR